MLHISCIYTIYIELYLYTNRVGLGALRTTYLLLFILIVEIDCPRPSPKMLPNFLREIWR